MNEPGRGDVLTRPGIDVILGGLVSVIAYAVAYRTLSAHFRVAPAIEDLLATCTGRLGWMPDPSALVALPQWTAFLERRLAVFPCDAINGFRLFEIGSSWELQRYFHVALYAWFRLVGPTINGFITFQSASYAVSSAIAYRIFRLGMGRIIALACAAAFIWSPSHLAMAGLPIEYAKAPWVLAVIWLCGVIVRRGANGQPIGWTALALGLTAGVGIGFKTDLLTIVPLAIATPVLFGRSRHAGGPWRTLTAALLVTAGVAIGGGPMLYRNFFSPAGSVAPIQLIGGQDWQTESLHASSPLYDYGVTWDDTYVDAMVNSYGRRVAGTTTRLRFFTREMQTVATRLLLDLWTTFPGDLVLRGVAAIIRVLRLNGWSPLIALAGCFIVLCRSQRDGWFVMVSTIYLSVCASLVFQRRHIFHLEVIPWWLAGVVAQAAVLAAMPLRDAFCDRDWRGLFDTARARFLMPAAGAALSLLLAGAAGWGILEAARHYQQAKVAQLVERYQQAPRQIRSTTTAPFGTGDVAIRVAGVSDRDPQTAAPAIADYLVVRVRCQASGFIRVRALYEPPVPASSNWNRDFNLVCADAGGESTLMMPIYQPEPTYRFASLIMSRTDAASIVSVSTLAPDSAVTIWPDLLVPADWRTRHWFETMVWPPAMPI